MKVLKFGGTSVGSAKHINKVIDILRDIPRNESVITVVSAIGGITDKLLAAAKLAVDKKDSYKEAFRSIETIHLDIIEQLIPGKNRAQVAKTVTTKLSFANKTDIIRSPAEKNRRAPLLIQR